MLGENFYRRLGFLKFRLKKLQNVLERTRLSTENVGHFLEDFSLAKTDAQEFLSVDEKKFWRLVEDWPGMEEQLFHKKGNLEGFYRSWQGEFARANICANLFNQFVSADIYHAVQPHIAAARRVLDYGCGTASVTLAHASRAANGTEFVLVELQEDVRKFIAHRVAKHAWSVQAKDIDQMAGEPPFDLVMCIDVLEHLENPSQVLAESLLPQVKIGGHLILRAPWRGQLTHIDEAPEDFYRQGGRQVLAKHFIEVERIGGNDVDAVYKRVR